VGLISTGGYFHWRYARLFPLEVISTGGAPGYFHWRSLFPLEVIISTGGHYFHWRCKKRANGQKIGKNEQMPEK
jgi:hypothetical protein